MKKKSLAKTISYDWLLNHIFQALKQISTDMMKTLMSLLKTKNDVIKNNMNKDIIIKDVRNLFK